jgi:hypothetical protein
MTDIAGSFQPDEQVRAGYEQLFTEVYRPLFLAVQPQLRQLVRLRDRLAEGGQT